MKRYIILALSVSIFSALIAETKPSAEYTTMTLSNSDTLSFEADSITMNPSTNSVKLTGNVCVLTRSFTLYSNTLTFTIEKGDSTTFPVSGKVPLLETTKIAQLVKFNADCSMFSTQTRELILAGNVEIVQGDLKFTSEAIRVVIK